MTELTQHLGTCDTQHINEPHTKCRECENWRPVPRAAFEAWARAEGFTDFDFYDGHHLDATLDDCYAGWKAGRSSLESENARLREAASYAIAMIGSVLKSAQCVIGPTDTVMLQESKKQLTLARGAIRGGTNV